MSPVVERQTGREDPSTALTGKVIWVTGAGKGLGRAIARALAQRGATVVATARTIEDLDELHQELPDNLRSAPGSVTSEDDVERIVVNIAAQGRLDGLVNCAGISPSFTRSEDLSVEVFQSVMETNALGTFLCARAAGRVMLAQDGGGSIVNVSSVHASVGYPRIAAYAASKGAVDALTKSLAVEWADRGVRVNTLTPGYFRTDLSKGLLGSKWGGDVLRRIPMGRTGEPSELGEAAVFLLSDGSSYMTGSNITIDGGWQSW